MRSVTADLTCFSFRITDCNVMRCRKADDLRVVSCFTGVNEDLPKYLRVFAVFFPMRCKSGVFEFSKPALRSVWPTHVAFRYLV